MVPENRPEVMRGPNMVPPYESVFYVGLQMLSWASTDNPEDEVLGKFQQISDFKLDAYHRMMAKFFMHTIMCSKNKYGFKN